MSETETVRRRGVARPRVVSQQTTTADPSLPLSVTSPQNHSDSRARASTIAAFRVSLPCGRHKRPSYSPQQNIAVQAGNRINHPRDVYGNVLYACSMLARIGALLAIEL